jgi:hypothetical protein
MLHLDKETKWSIFYFGSTTNFVENKEIKANFNQWFGFEDARLNDAVGQGCPKSELTCFNPPISVFGLQTSYSTGLPLKLQ